MSAPSTTTQETVTANPAVRNTDIWTLLGLAILGVRLVQGWVYWGVPVDGFSIMWASWTPVLAPTWVTK
jgi:hypothetical protein